MAGYIVYVYADLIHKGQKTIDQVPASIRKDVEIFLKHEKVDGK